MQRDVPHAWVAEQDLRRRVLELVLQGIQINLLVERLLRRTPQTPKLCVCMLGLVDEANERSRIRGAAAQ
jgi:hypothetical protein